MRSGSSAKAWSPHLPRLGDEVSSTAGAIGESLVRGAMTGGWMAPKPKIQNADEAIRWIAEGRTYTWMTAEHERKYNIRISPSGWSYFRRTHGLGPRQIRDEELIP